MHTNGWERSFQPSMKARILVLRSLTDVNTPRRMAWRSMMPNQTSTRFIQEACVGVKWILNRVLGQPFADVLVLVCGVVVHHQVQLDRLAGRSVDRVAVGPLDLFEKRQCPVPDSHSRSARFLSRGYRLVSGDVAGHGGLLASAGGSVLGWGSVAQR